MRTSISYSRYFRMAMPIARYRNTSARSKSTCPPTVLVKNVTMKVTATIAAAVTNHFSWRRSSPLACANLRRRATNDSTNVTGRAKATIRKATVAALAAADEPDEVSWANGRDQFVVASTKAVAVSRTSTAPQHQATGRQLGAGSRPVGNRRNRKGSREMGMVHIQLESQANARPAGNEPGCATRAKSA